MTATIETLPPVAREEQERLLSQVDSLLDSYRANYDCLSKCHTEIGIALLRVQETGAWMLRHKTLDQFIRACEGRFGRARTTLYASKRTAEYLLPAVGEQTLREMGSTKAQILAGFCKRHDKKPTPELIEAAKDPSVDIAQFKASVAEAEHTKPETGKWYEFLGGFYTTPEERQEFDRVIAAGKAQVELPPDSPEWLERKLVAQAMIAECSASWKA